MKQVPIKLIKKGWAFFSFKTTHLQIEIYIWSPCTKHLPSLEGQYVLKFLYNIVIALYF